MIQLASDSVELAQLVADLVHGNDTPGTCQVKSIVRSRLLEGGQAGRPEAVQAELSAQGLPPLVVQGLVAEAQRDILPAQSGKTADEAWEKFWSSAKWVAAGALVLGLASRVPELPWLMFGAGVLFTAACLVSGFRMVRALSASGRVRR
jgi:hypothetical protein